jgi:hypothetical protein
VNSFSLDGLKNGDRESLMSGDIRISYFMSPDSWVCCHIFLGCCRRMDIRKRLDVVNETRYIVLRKLGQELKGGNRELSWLRMHVTDGSQPICGRK